MAAAFAECALEVEVEVHKNKVDHCWRASASIRGCHQACGVINYS